MSILLPIGLSVAGLLFLLAEVLLVPRRNAYGWIGFSLLVGTVAYLMWGVGPVAGLLATVLLFAAVGLLYLVVRMAGRWEQYVTETRRPDRTPSAAPRMRLLGREGKAITPLRPSGIVDVEGEQVEAYSEGEFIAAGSRIRIVARDRRRYFVKLVTSEASA